MIIPWEPGGGLGNRLFISAYAISLAKASGQRCFNLQLGEFEDLFPATKPLVLRGRTRTFVYRVLVALVRRLKRLPPARPFFITFSTDGKNSPHYSPGNPAFIAEVQGRWFTLVNGWPFIEFMTFPHSETIREIFTPRAEVLAEAENAARRAKGDADVLVGMHIRQGGRQENVRRTLLLSQRALRRTHEERGAGASAPPGRLHDLLERGAGPGALQAHADFDGSRNPVGRPVRFFVLRLHHRPPPALFRYGAHFMGGRTSSSCTIPRPRSTCPIS